MDDLEMLLRAANSLRAESSDYVDISDEPLTIMSAIITAQLIPGRDVERSLKNHSSTRECPLCTANKKKFLFRSKQKKLKPFVFLFCMVLMLSCSKEPLRSPKYENSRTYFIKNTFSSDRTKLLQTDTLWTGPARDIDTTGYPQWQYVCNPPTWEYYFISDK